MAVKNVGAIYATNSKLLLRVVIPSDDDSEIDRHAQLTAGESLLLVPVDTFRKEGPSAVQAVVGAPTFSGVCAVVDKDSNMVVDRIMADPELYAHPDGHPVIASDEAMLGDTWTGAEFTRQYAEVDDTTGKIVAVKEIPISAITPEGKSTNYMVPTATLSVVADIDVTVQAIVDKIALKG